jgi:hypothetical protein
MRAHELLLMGLQVPTGSCCSGGGADSVWGTVLGTVAVHPGPSAVVYEATVQLEAKGAHTRIGWCGAGGTPSGAVGADIASYGYQDAGGKMFHDGYGQPFGDAYKSGSVLGCVLVPATANQPAEIRLFKDGVDQGAVSVRHSLGEAGCWWPTVSVYGAAHIEVQFGSIAQMLFGQNYVDTCRHRHPGIALVGFGNF